MGARNPPPYPPTGFTVAMSPRWQCRRARELYQLSENPGGQSVVVRNGVILLPTAAAALVKRECNSKAEIRVPVSSHGTKTAGLSPPVKTSAADTVAPALYTKDQAERGAQIFATKCVSCHGANLQGTAAPSVAGTDFLATAEHDGWTLEAIRYLVVNNMPFDAPGSLYPPRTRMSWPSFLPPTAIPRPTNPFRQRTIPLSLKSSLALFLARIPAETSSASARLVDDRRLKAHPPPASALAPLRGAFSPAPFLDATSAAR